MAESTFGRRAVNDGKLVQRLRDGKRITTDTLERIQGFIGEAGIVSGAAPIRRPEPPMERGGRRRNRLSVAGAGGH